MNKFLEIIINLPWWVKNVYFGITIFFIFWMIFFDRNNVFNTYQISKKLGDLQDQKAYFNTEIEEVNKLKEELFSTQEKKEKFAREKYFMKKANEDIFVVIEEN